MRIYQNSRISSDFDAFTLGAAHEKTLFLISGRGLGNKDPAMSYFRAGSTIIAPKCLSAVFGMGTGVSTWVWSPGYS